MVLNNYKIDFSTDYIADNNSCYSYQVSHGTIGSGQHARDGHVALPGVLRSATATPHGYGKRGKGTVEYGRI